MLDWEFAHAGVPGADLGNLLRIDRAPGFVAAVLDGYLEVAGHLDGLGGNAGRARLVDLAARRTWWPWWSWLHGAGKTPWRTRLTHSFARWRPRVTSMRRLAAQAPGAGRGGGQRVFIMAPMRCSALALGWM